ncbi:MAG: F0F1 ATP synthase subunit A [Bacteroidota bacterium]|nr:F0F1 ATP synthase subunit A [Bacteroidota bacterium]
MIVERVKCLLVLVFSVFFLSFSANTYAQQHKVETDHVEEVHAEGIKNSGENKFDAQKVIFGHVLDAHEFHFFSYKGKDGKEHHATIPLPVILYSPQKGLSVFSSSRFEHGHASYDGYKLSGNNIVPVDKNVKVYDLSLTRNVVQMFIALALLVLIMSSIAKKYRTGKGVTTAPSGFQNAIEPVITFVRDEVARPNLGPTYRKYMPYLLTVFFFILINNILGLIPGAANVTGNIAFTMILGVISFIVILISSNKHFWGHIFNPPVPMGVKPILVLVEFLSIFTKPFSLIIRLFANMLAGHIIIICLISLIFIFGGLSRGVGWGFSPISISFTVFIYFIEILVAFLQAYIFTNLTAVFIGQSMEGSHHNGNDGHKAPAEPVII